MIRNKVRNDASEMLSSVTGQKKCLFIDIRGLGKHQFSVAIAQMCKLKNVHKENSAKQC
ncbi:20_t:CDS:2, partial [Cetraspora pellucida]